MRCRGRRGVCNLGAIIASFGIGLVVSFCCPKTVLLAILAVAVIVLGVIISK